VDIHLIAGFILGAIIGIRLGLFSSGGSTIAVPVFVYIIGIEAHQAIGMSLAVVGATSLVGVGLHSWHGTVKVKIGILFSISGIVGAYFGSYLTDLIPSAALLFLFAILMVIIGLLMLIKRNGERRVTTINQNRSTLLSILKFSACTFSEINSVQAQNNIFTFFAPCSKHNVRQKVKNIVI
jgi:uncharacterized protein